MPFFYPYLVKSLMRFDWQTEEDDWENNLETNDRNPAVSSKLSSYLRFVLAVILVVFVVGWSVSQLAKEQVVGATDSLSAELLAVYSLLNQSVYENDFELFESFLSDQNSYSRQLPLDLYRAHYFLDRPFLNLYAGNILSDDEPQVEFSPDLTRAELTALQAYLPRNDPTADPIWLERLTLFRKVDGRWQLTRWPIDEDFWGDTQEERVGRLTAEFPTRDELHGRRLAQDIGRLLDNICQDDSINCPPNFRLKMLLVPYGQNLLDMNDNYRTLPLSSGYDAYRIFLPTPTLVGRPIDEVGYQALYHGYASWIAAVLVQHYSRIRPVTHDVTANLLAQWQLTPPPTTVLPGPVSTSSTTGPGRTVVENIEAPDQDILLVCQGYSPPTWLSYNPASDTWQTIPPPDNAPALAQLLQGAGERSRFPPEGQGSLIRRPFYTNGIQSWHSYLWLGGLTNQLETAANPALFLADPRHQQPDSGHLLFYPFDGQGNPYLAETAACLNDDCYLEQLEGIPTWSPSGQQTLLTVQEEDGTPQLYLGDARGRPFHFLSNGYSGQWLAEDSFLFVGEGGSTIYNGRIDPGGSLIETERLADISSLFSPQVFDEPPQNPVITSLAVHPAQQTWVIISIAHPNSQSDSLLLLNRQTNRLNFGFSQSNLQFSLPFYFSGDGRFLTIPAFESGTLSGGWQLLVFDLDPVAGNWQYNTETAYFDWSADSQWLLIAEDDALRLIAPRHDYERRIPHNLGCHTIGWYN